MTKSSRTASEEAPSAATETVAGGRAAARKWTAVFVLFAIGGLTLAISIPRHGPTGLLALPLGIFLVYWYRLFGSAITNRRRASFDEANVLATYQPRAKGEGKKFVADPPTPLLTSPPDGDDDDSAASATTSSQQRSKEPFEQVRDAHYGDMWRHVQRVQMELEEEGDGQLFEQLPAAEEVAKEESTTTAIEDENEDKEEAAVSEYTSKEAVEMSFDELKDDLRYFNEEIKRLDEAEHKYRVAEQQRLTGSAAATVEEEEKKEGDSVKQVKEEEEEEEEGEQGERATFGDRSVSDDTSFDDDDDVTVTPMI